MSTFDFVNEETGTSFRVRIVRRGETYARGATHRRNEPLVEFHAREKIASRDENGQFIASYSARQFLGPHPVGLSIGMAQALWKITAENCQQIAAWLAGEIDKPWTPPAPPPRPLPNTPTGPVPAGKHKVTIYVGTSRHEATWVEVLRHDDAQYKEAYFIKFIPKRARLIREFVEHREPNAVIVEGWGHPDFSVTRDLLATGSTSLTIGSGGQDPREAELGRYLETLPLSRILLDTRGVIVEEDC